MSSSRPHRRHWIAAALCLCAGAAAFAQELEISVSPTPIGSGARAAGMADAFVAIADDATAASWNPAGLVQLERPEISLVGSWNAVFEEFSALFHPEVDSRHNISNTDLNYLSVVYPLPFLVLGRNATVSLNYQSKYDFTRKFSMDFNSGFAAGPVPVYRLLRLDFDQKGGLSTISPAFAIEITQRLSVGAAFNFWRKSFLSDNGWEQTVTNDTQTFFGVNTILARATSREEYENFSGENATLGLLWNPTPRVSLGMRYDTAFTGAADYRRIGASWQLLLPSPFNPAFLSVAPNLRKEKRHIRFPDSLAVGAALRLNDRLTLSMDVTRTDWNDFYVQDSQGNKNSLVDFANLREPLRWTKYDPTFTVRGGFEYIFVPRQPSENLGALWTLRGGLFFDQEPATNKKTGFRLPGDNGNGDPDDFYGVTLGAGVQVKRRVNIDFAWQLRYGDNVNSDFIRGVSGFSEDIFQHRVLLSTVIYF